MTNFNFIYPVNLRKQKEGGYLVEFPDFPEAITQGEDELAALEAASDCLEETIANRMVMGLEIPVNTSLKYHKYLIPLHITLAAKCALFLAMRKIKCKNVTLAKMLDCDEKEVRRLLNPRYKSKISKIEEALQYLGERVTLSITIRPGNSIPVKLNNHYNNHEARY